MSELQRAYEGIKRLRQDLDNVGLLSDRADSDVATIRVFLDGLEEEWGIAHPSTLAKPQKVANRLTALARAEFLIRKRNLPRQPVVRYVSKWTRG